jgi:hypothetical protein
MRNRGILLLALGFTILLGVLSLWALFTYGPRPLELLSLLVLALFAYGIVGALLHPPDD